MKLTKKQRIALEFLAEVGPVSCQTIAVAGIMTSLYLRGLVAKRGNAFGPYYRITDTGREALKEAQK